MATLAGVTRQKFAATLGLFLSSIFLMGAGLASSDYLHGIDVSRYQLEINWDNVKEANVSFAFMKATEGSFLKDPYFDRNWEQAQARGIKRGAYHFYIPWIDAADQVAHFTRTVTLAPGDLPPVLDVEAIANDISDVEIRRGIQTWLTSIERFYGIKPIIYTYQAYYNQKLKGHFTGYHFWIARYNEAEPYTHPKDRMFFWQYTERGTVSGIETPVDLNWFYGDLAALNKLCVPAPMATPQNALAQNQDSPE